MTPALLVVLAACTTERAPADPTPHTVDPTDTATTTTGSTSTGTPTATTSPWPELSCDDPSARAEAHYDRFALPALPASDANLMGGGVAVADFDGDGRLDLFLTGESSVQLWLGTGDPGDPFAPTTGWFDGIDLSLAVGAVAVDLDDDGSMDLVVTRYGAPNRLLENRGGAFADITPASIEAHAWRTQAATLADLDGDGDLDLFFGSYGDRPATSNDPAMAPADPAELYRNDSGTWVDVSDRLPVEVHDAYTFSASFLDIDGDGLPEGFVANDFGEVRPSVRLVPTGDLGFTADATWHVQAEDMGLGVGDVNGDAVPDFLVTSAIDIYALASGDAVGAPGIWVDSAGAWAIATEQTGSYQYFGWASEWFDADNDGDQDGLALFGHWIDWFTPDQQRDSLWIQTGPLLFTELSEDPLWNVADVGPGRGLAVADLNGDGWLDLVKRQVGEETPIYLSRCGSEHAVLVSLEQSGANRQAIGARVQARVGDAVQTEWIVAGGSGLYGGGPPIAHFGLGSADRIDEIAVRWPDGTEQTWQDLPADVHLTLAREP